MEKDYQHRVINKYFIAAGVKSADIRIEQSKIDVIISGIFSEPHTLIEFKEVFKNREEINKALTQIVLTAEKHKIFGKYYGVFGQYEGQDTFVFFEHDVDIFKSMSFNVHAEKFDIQEKPSNPSPEAITNITAALKGRTREVRDGEIIPIIKELLNNNSKLVITEKNIDSIFMRWCDEIVFEEYIKNDDEKVNLFLTDILNETIYKRKVQKVNLLGEEECNTSFEIYKKQTSILFRNKNDNYCYTLNDVDLYNKFWSIYDRPPDEKTFLKLFEKRHIFFSEKHRKETGAQYTPQILVKLQNEILQENLGEDWESKYVIFDCCCGSANLQENIVNKDRVFLSTLEQGDVYLAKSKGFTNIIQYDFLQDNEMPKWNYNALTLTINEIAKIENKEILVLINPPYEKEMFIEFVEKIVKNIPNCKFFLYSHYKLFSRNDFFTRLANLKPTIVSNNIVSAELFGLSNWGISMTLLNFNTNNKDKPKDRIKAIRWEQHKLNKDILEKQGGKIVFVPKKESYKDYFYEQLKTYSGKLLNNEKEIILGHYNVMGGGMIFDNIPNYDTLITNKNLEQILICNGILYNTHPEYWEYEILKYPQKKLDKIFISDCIINSIFYKSNKTINTKEHKNYFVPFTEQELFGENSHRLNAIIENATKLFDFRDWLAPYKKEMSKEAKELYNASLEIYKFYFNYFGKDADCNVGWMQLKDSLLQGKIVTEKQHLSKKNAITGFSTRIGENSTWRPSILDRKYNTNIFTIYDNALLNLFAKIQDGMIEHGIIEQRMAKLR